MPLLTRERRRGGYLVHPVDIPADKVYTEKPSRVPTFRLDVVGVTVLCVVLAGMLFWALSGSVRVAVGAAGFGRFCGEERVANRPCLNSLTFCSKIYRICCSAFQAKDQVG